MDLIAGYGSGSDSDSGGHDRAQTASDGQPHQQMQSQPKAAASARKAVGLSLDADESSMPSTTAAALFSKLPQPSVATKRVVNFQVPLRQELLAKAKARAADGAADDDEDAPAAKRFRSSTGPKGKMALLSMLPAPKNEGMRLAPSRDRGMGLAGAAGVFGGGGGGEGQDREGSGGEQQAGLGTSKGAGTSGAPPSNFFDGGRTGSASTVGGSLPDQALGNEAYRVDVSAQQDAAYAGYDHSAYYHDPQYAAYYQQYYAQHPQHPPQHPQPQQQQPHYQQQPQQQHQQQPKKVGRGLPAEGEDLLQAALRAEQERMAKRAGKGGASALQVVEVRQDALTAVGHSERGASTSLADTLGSDYANQLRSEAAAAAGNKLARRKHQIGTLLANAKLHELELLEKNPSGVKNKRETMAKYGWA